MSDHPDTSNQNKDQGFSLIEVIVAIGILSLIGLGVLQAFPFGSMIVKSAEKQTRAVFAAQAKAEEIMSLDYYSISAGEIEPRHNLGAIDPELAGFERRTVVYYIDDELQATSTNPADDFGLLTASVSIFYHNSMNQNEEQYDLNFLISRR
jgi:prepilin-type N-terminal cleavage/methylation domain-containing protein